MLVRFIAAILLCLTADFVYNGFWLQDYFFNRPLEGYEFVMYSRWIAPPAAKCKSNSSVLWRMKGDEGLWSWIGARSSASPRTLLKVWVLRRLGQLSPVLFDQGVRWLVDAERPILILHPSPKSEAQDSHSLLRNAILGQSVNEHMIVSCAPNVRTEETVFYQMHRPPKLEPLGTTEYRGRVQGLGELQQRELADPAFNGFGLLEVLFPGADAALLSYKAGSFDFYPYTSRGGLKIHCAQGQANCAVSRVQPKELEGLAATLNERWIWSLNPSDVNSRGRSSRWQWLAGKRRARACATLENPAMQEIAQAWLSLDGSDAQAARTQSRDGLCARVDVEQAEKIAQFTIRQRKSFGEVSEDSEF